MFLICKPGNTRYPEYNAEKDEDQDQNGSEKTKVEVEALYHKWYADDKVVKYFRRFQTKISQ